MAATTPRQWPAEGVARVPYWAYSDPELYALEQDRIFSGRSWSYVALEAEIPRPRRCRVARRSTR